MANPNAALFERQSDSQENRLGRGTAFIFQHGDMTLVRRHYQRGGLVRHFIRDVYFGWDLHQTRVWKEFQLLMELQARNLPVPTPIAARFQRVSPISYRADLVTEFVPESRTLAQALQKAPLSQNLWQALGHQLKQFHQHGVYHADLNANNILLAEQQRFFLIDFDKGDRRKPDASWQQDNLQRLRRSLDKLALRYDSFYFQEADWQQLLTGYAP